MSTTAPTAPLSGVCVVIPMHDEAAVIAEVVAGCVSAFEHVVCVDDGSRDDSAGLARAAGAVVLRHAVNLGQGAALQTGIEYAVSRLRADHVVTFDADGQHGVADARDMVLRARAEDVQVVLGTRFASATSTDMPAGRRRVLRAAAAFTRLTTGLPVTDAHNGLRVLRRDAAAQIALRLHGMAHASEILHQVARGGWSWTEHPVRIAYTEYSVAKGQRSYNALNIAVDLLLDRARVGA